MASSTENVKIGVCQVLWHVGAAGAAVDLGYTKGGVTVSVTTDTYEVKVDQFGETPISENITARRVEAVVPLAETTIENLLYTMPGAKKNVAGDRVDVKTAIGTNMLSTGAKLILRPLYKGALTTEDFVILKAATSGGLEFAYNHDAERVFNVTFKGYPDTEVATKDVLFSFGDSAAAPAVW